MDTRIDTLSILRDFHKITGARISLHDLSFKEIMSYPQDTLPFCEAIQNNPGQLQKCFLIDSKAFKTVKKTEQTYTYRCHCGLIEIVAPIYSYGVLSGYFMMGQITDEQQNSFEEIKKLSKGLIPTEKAEKLLNGIPRLPDNLIGSYINILKVLSEYMTHTNRMIPRSSDLAEKTKIYINKNYTENLSINNMCEIFACSRTTLINNFRKRYGINIGDYINNRRLSAAAEKLEKSEDRINKISAECGFRDQNYFSKVFSKKYGLTPSEYRKKHK